MLYCGCIIFVKDNKANNITDFVLSFNEVTLYTISDDGSMMVVTIEAESDKKIEQIIKKLKEHELIIDVSPHYMHFEEEVDRILKTGEKPDLTGFSKSERRKSKDEV